MLKALELVGFKSFADKTRFEFPPGVTVVVGPNGSGKSNVVDAVKWVLGEQSVKSLRGKEMADVIFNGSVSRRAVNSAEATLTFDNAAGQLAIDTSEVHVTRRVYRSGEGEYLINRQACRLRDIRDLFAGTGAATEAYSVIEQGKVDVMLQSSPRDRRVIFEEAAGISRFKAKKLEATRRLERVDQNLLRLSDIVDEVESRLRSVRMQATKARRYKEHTDRLQELRTQVALTERRALTETLEAAESRLGVLRDEAGKAGAQLEVNEARTLELEAEIARLEEVIRGRESEIANNREAIATRESTIDHQRARSRDLHDEVARYRRHLVALSSRAGDLRQHLEETREAIRSAETEHQGHEQKLRQDEAALAEVATQHTRLRERSGPQREQHVECMRASANLGNRISALESMLATAEQTRGRHREEIDGLETNRTAAASELERLGGKLQQLTDDTEASATRLQASHAQLTGSRRRLTSTQKELAQLEGRRTGAVERANVLEELERRLEGLSAGVKEVLVKARANPSGPFRQVRGLTADLLQVQVETAPLIDAALGNLAQHLVVAPGRELLDFLERESAAFSSEVGFLRLDVEPPASPLDRVNLEGQSGVVGRADRYVQTSPEFVPLVRRLLGRTWIVEQLSHALALCESSGRGLDFVTLAGERVTAEGTVTVGPRNLATGLISRRSELRALQTTIAELEAEVGRCQNACAELETQVGEAEDQVAQHTAEHQKLSDELSRHRLNTAAAEQRLAELQQRLETLQTEMREADQQHQDAAQELRDAQQQLAANEKRLAAIEKEIDADNALVLELEEQRSRLGVNVSDGRVELAKSEQRCDHLRRHLEQLDREGQERSRAVAEAQSQLEQSIERLEQSGQRILKSASEVAELYLRKEALAAEVVALLETREGQREERGRLADATHQLRGSLRKLEDQIHAQQLVAGEVEHQRAALAGRLREDYEIELAELDHEPTAEELHEREAVEEEIAELRRKINNIGSVNLDALTELEELESRFESLSAQHDDLSKAKASLEQIIGKINADSRRLFQETLETVCGHFQSLFRKLFGGGQADIVLEEDVDVLESGIEIVARPPGKEPRSISLLSGGEKTLTCVALLLAIFRSRPSPFCILDEVDAALDEANIERFLSVLKEFLSWTQFIVVTHSKKTMTCANTLYGITMQESGISKRVSVRFEDVSEDGEISQQALERREADEEPASVAGDDETQAA